MKINYNFRRGDRVFVCQVGYEQFGSWGRVIWRSHAGYPMKVAPWYVVKIDGGRSCCYHESWLN